MPNYVYNIIQATGDKDEVKRMMDAVTTMTEEGIPCFDFNKLIPMPEELRVTNDGTFSIRDHINHYLTMVNPNTPDYEMGFEKLSDEEFGELYKALCEYYNQENSHLLNCYMPVPNAEEAQQGDKLAHNIANYGDPTWYEWSIKHWGTKWNAFYPTPADENTLSFCTAWASPIPIVDKLAEMFPSLEFEHRWADENYGCNLGRSIYKNGKFVDGYSPEECTEEAYEFAASVYGYDPRAEEPSEDNDEQPEM